ncbi:MAG: hypothetical protein ABUT20_42495 [Bacteroidota bacterium]
MKILNLLPELPYPKSTLGEILLLHHSRYREQFPNWSLLATRRKLIVSYWLKTFLHHFCTILLTATFLVLIADSGRPVQFTLFSMLPAAIVSFCTLSITMYLPAFHAEFLPHLDSFIESYKVSDQLKDLIPLCKKQQYSVVALMLVQQTYQQMAGLGASLINTENARLLARQYGVSEKSIGNALQLILQYKWDRKSIRKRTEIINDFEAAKEHFKKLSYGGAVVLLDQLQLQILSGS